MLNELHVSHLGVIEDVTILLGPGMTALTGETGAGKTLLVDAIQLLLGGPADPTVVRPGAAEALVEGRFDAAKDEVILARAVPSAGRSRAYVDGRMASVSLLSEAGGALVDMHGQHGHQSLLTPKAQKALLDRFAGISTAEVHEARRVVRDIEDAQRAIGGDERSRAREMALVRFQLGEIDAAGLESTGEDALLREEEERLSDATSLREAAWAVYEGVAGDDEVLDRLGAVASAVVGRPALAELHRRLVGAIADLGDVAADARSSSETFEDDPERLAAVGARRQLLTDLRRKYGDTLEEVIGFREQARKRLAELESHDSRAAELERQLSSAKHRLREAERRLGDARRAAAPAMSAEVERRLRELAMPKARFVVAVSDDAAGDTVTWMLGANPGEPVLPLAKVASGGELARTMLAARLVVGHEPGETADAPVTLVFDEVDAGVGGEAAVAVGRALAALGEEHQVLVVTHLPQVAAFADQHLVVRKETSGKRTVARVSSVAGQDRVVEVSRMLSGSPESETARRHAEELLVAAGSHSQEGRPR